MDRNRPRVADGKSTSDEPSVSRTSRVGVVGTGQVGMAAASSLFQSQFVAAIHLVDLDEARAAGEAMDLMHGQALVGPCAVTSGGYDGLVDASVVVVTAGVSQQPGEDRLALLHRNVLVFEAIVRELDRVAPEAVVVIATNPVDVLTQVFQDETARDRQLVIGTGTTLDSARLRALLGERYGINPQSVHASVLGEHGDTEFVPWSLASIGGQPLIGSEIFGVAWDLEEAARIETEVRQAAYEIINRKGYTNWAIGAVIDELVGIILRDERAVVPISVRPPSSLGMQDVCLSLPTRLGRQGALDVLAPTLLESELDALRASAAKLHASAKSLAAG